MSFLILITSVLAADPLYVDGDLELRASGEYVVQLQPGPAGVEVEGLHVVSGHATIDGWLIVQAAGPLDVTSGYSTHVILSSQSLSGEFQNDPAFEYLGHGVTVALVKYIDTAVQVVVYQWAPGDVNFDTWVDEDDLAHIADVGSFNNGTGWDWEDGDFDGDGDVDNHDLQLMMANRRSPW